MQRASLLARFRGWLRNRGLALRERFANWLLDDVHLRGAVWFGPNSITLKSGVIDFDATAVPAAKGEVGMDITTGLLSIYTDAAKTIALSEDVGGLTVEEKTVSYNVTAADSGKLLTNEGAAGTITFSLPTAVAGLIYYFWAQAGQSIVISAAAGDTVAVGFTTSSVGGSISSPGSAGDQAFLVAINATEWVAISFEGSWF